MNGVDNSLPRRYVNPCPKDDECDRSGGGCGECSAIDHGIKQRRKETQEAVDKAGSN